MATTSFLATPAITDSVTLKAYIQALGDALRGLSDLTQVTGQSNTGVVGGAMIDMTDKTGTGVTTTASSVNFSGTFSSGGLSQSDVGRRILIPGAGAAGVTLYGTIATVTSATTGTLVANASTSIAGSGTATIGVVTGINGGDVGREIFRFNDALQSTDPIFIIFIYGSQGTPSVTNQPTLKIRVAKAVNGFGDAAGPATDALAAFYNAGSQGDNKPRTCYISSDAGRLQIYLWGDSTVVNCKGFLSVKRMVNSLGIDEARGVNVLTMNANTKAQQYLPKDGAQFPETSMAEWMAAVPPSGGGVTTGIFDGNTGIFPVIPFLGREDNPAMDAVVVRLSDFTNLTTLNVPMYGSTRTFRVMNITSSISGITNCYAAMRWE